ncbi:polysaccharide deacetylase family protein [Aeromicrobium phragmitis]|nr:polysaccharide deacetylase family protein [Aeromicrobium phragmitis]
MSASSPDPISGLRLAVTVDDQFQWTGIPFPDGYDPARVSGAMVTAFREHQVPGVYAFNSTAPTEEHPEYLDVLDTWMAAGHYVGNHTHQHISLNWLDVGTYLRDVEASEKVLDRWIAASPSRYFRYAFGMEGDALEKTRAVQTHLTRQGFLSSPVTMWFYDAQFMVAYHRAIALRDREAMRRVEDLLVATAIEQIRSQASAAQRAIGRVPSQILLIHGTAVAGATIGRVCAELRQLGAEFITSEEAMADPANVIGAPYTTRQFRNMTQKWAEFAGFAIDNMPPKVLAEVETIAVIDGESYEEVLGRAITEWTRRVAFTPVPNDFH